MSDAADATFCPATPTADDGRPFFLSTNHKLAAQFATNQPIFVCFECTGRSCRDDRPISTATRCARPLKTAQTVQPSSGGKSHVTGDLLKSTDCRYRSTQKNKSKCKQTFRNPKKLVAQIALIRRAAGWRHRRDFTTRGGDRSESARDPPGLRSSDG